MCNLCMLGQIVYCLSRFVHLHVMRVWVGTVRTDHKKGIIFYQGHNQLHTHQVDHN